MDGVDRRALVRGDRGHDHPIGHDANQEADARAELGGPTPGVVDRLELHQRDGGGRDRDDTEPALTGDEPADERERGDHQHQGSAQPSEHQDADVEAPPGDSPRRRGDEHHAHEHGQVPLGVGDRGVELLAGEEQVHEADERAQRQARDQPPEARREDEQRGQQLRL